MPGRVWLPTALAALALSCGGAPEVARPDGVGEPPAGTFGADARRYVITIASDDYAFEGFAPLDRAEADADAIERAFVDRLGFEARADLRLRGEGATTDAIRHLVGDEGPLKGLPRDAMAVVYIALHGRTRDCAAPTVEGERPRPRRCGQLVTRDAERSSQTIELTYLLERVARHGPHHTIVLIDACHGGLALGAPIEDLDYATLLSGPRGPGERRSRKVLTSAGASEAADDGGPGRPGVFAEALLEGLDGAADLYADGWLLFPELAVYLHAEVYRRSRGAQEPEYDGFHDDGRGAPVLGALRLAEGSAGDPEALFEVARAQVERREVHAAMWSLRQALAARAGRALAERRALRAAEALAADGKGAEAIAAVERMPRSARGPALAVRRAVQARMARQTGRPAAEVARLEARAAEAGLAVAGKATGDAGRARLVSGLGGLAALGGAPRVAGELAAGARTAAEASGDAAGVAALARNEAAAFAAAGDAARAAAARAVEQAAEASSAPPAPEPVEPEATATAPLPTVEVSGEWPTIDKPFIDDEASLEPAQRLALARAWAGRVADVSRAPIDRVERFGRLLAAVERARLEGASPTQVAEVRSAVVGALRAMFPLPSGLDDEALTGGWVALPGGEFEMGSPPGEAGRDEDEVLHRVRLSPFRLGEAEVTVGQFRRLVPGYRLEDDDLLPARWVSWYAAAVYAAWVGARLPTEAEWEYGARWRGEGSPLARTRYCAGDTVADLDRVGWFESNSGGEPHPVKQKAACGGLYDMHGNAWEWVADWYGPYEAPASGAALADPAGPPTDDVRVLRGGGFDLDAVYARSAERSRWRPRSRVHWIGFRLARSLPSPDLDP